MALCKGFAFLAFSIVLSRRPYAEGCLFWFSEPKKALEVIALLKMYLEHEPVSGEKDVRAK